MRAKVQPGRARGSAWRWNLRRHLILWISAEQDNLKGSCRCRGASHPKQVRRRTGTRPEWTSVPNMCAYDSIYTQHSCLLDGGSATFEGLACCVLDLKPELHSRLMSQLKPTQTALHVCFWLHPALLNLPCAQEARPFFCSWPGQCIHQ